MTVIGSMTNNICVFVFVLLSVYLSVCMYYATIIITRAVEHESLQLKRDNDTIVKRIKQLVRIKSSDSDFVVPFISHTFVNVLSRSLCLHAPKYLSFPSYSIHCYTSTNCRNEKRRV